MGVSGQSKYQIFKDQVFPASTAGKVDGEVGPDFAFFSAKSVFTACSSANLDKLLQE